MANIYSVGFHSYVRQVNSDIKYCAQTYGFLWQVFKRTTCSCWKNIQTYKIQIKFKNCLKLLCNWPIDTAVTVSVILFCLPSVAGITKH